MLISIQWFLREPERRGRERSSRSSGDPLVAGMMRARTIEWGSFMAKRRRRDRVEWIDWAETLMNHKSDTVSPIFHGPAGMLDWSLSDVFQVCLVRSM